MDTGQQWTEVNFVPNWIGHRKNSAEDRFIVIRKPLNDQPLPGMEEQLEMSFATMELPKRVWHKVFGDRSVIRAQMISFRLTLFVGDSILALHKATRPADHCEGLGPDFPMESVAPGG